MLSDLYIENLATISQAQLKFERGLNVITGASGSGKSLIIRALHLIMGVKASVDLIRPGADYLTVLATFQLPPDGRNTAPFSRSTTTQKHHIQANRTLRIKRRINKHGRNFAWLNDKPASLTEVRAISPQLVDIVSQFDAHQLTKLNNQTRYLDAGIPAKLLTATQQKFHDLSLILKSIENTVERARKIDTEKGTLENQLMQISDLDPSIEDYEELVHFCRSGLNDVKVQQFISECLALLDGADTTELAGLTGNIRKAASRLESAAGLTKDKEIVVAAEKLFTVAESLDHISQKLAERLQHDGDSASRLDEAETRLARYQQLMRSFKINQCSELITIRTEVQEDLKLLEDIDGVLWDKSNDLEKAIVAFKNAAATLTRSREKHASQLNEGLKLQLESLNMAQIELRVVLESNTRTGRRLQEILPETDSTHRLRLQLADLQGAGFEGNEKLVIMMRSSPNSPFRSLTKTASGGELSRIILALKAVNRSQLQGKSSIFDEIDTGVGGKDASLVGRKLAEIAESSQVICISHHAQVAVYGQHHILVKKQITQGELPDTCAKVLNEPDSEMELARLLSGETVLESSIAHIRNLKRSHGSFVSKQ